MSAGQLTHHALDDHVFAAIRGVIESPGRTKTGKVRAGYSAGEISDAEGFRRDLEWFGRVLVSRPLQLPSRQQWADETAHLRRAAKKARALIAALEKSEDAVAQARQFRNEMGTGSLVQSMWEDEVAPHKWQDNRDAAFWTARLSWLIHEIEEELRERDDLSPQPPAPRGRRPDSNLTEWFEVLGRAWTDCGRTVGGDKCFRQFVEVCSAPFGLSGKRLNTPLTEWLAGRRASPKK